MTEDFADFLAALNSEGVVYVVIGGMAVLSHIPYRTTRDIDVLIEPTLALAAVSMMSIRPSSRQVTHSVDPSRERRLPWGPLPTSIRCSSPVTACTAPTVSLPVLET